MTATEPHSIPYATQGVSTHDLLLGDPTPVSRRSLAAWVLIVTATYTLLWSPYWYPLSDSSLYLSLARSLATGRGFTFQGDIHRLVPPLAPFLYSLLMRAGAGIGGIQAALIACMLLAHALCFLTLRRWVSERLALSAVLVTALSYWVFYNAFAVMSEPPCLVMFWGAMLLLSGVNGSPARGRRWASVLLACLLLLGAMECRLAAVFLVPGTVIALVVTARLEKWPTRIAWGLVFVLVFGAALAYFRWPTKTAYYLGLGPAPKTMPAGQPPPAGINAEYGMDDSGNTVREGRYKGAWLYGVKRDVRHFVTDVPALAGQWVAEGLAAAGVTDCQEPCAVVPRVLARGLAGPRRGARVRTRSRLAVARPIARPVTARSRSASAVTSAAGSARAARPTSTPSTRAARSTRRAGPRWRPGPTCMHARPGGRSRRARRAIARRTA